MRTFFVFLCFFTLSGAALSGFATPVKSDRAAGKPLPADSLKPLLEVILYTRGEVLLEGSTQTSITYTAPLGGRSKKDTLVFLRPTPKGSMLFSKTAIELAGDSSLTSHQKLSVKLPKKHDLFFSTTKGPVRIKDIEGNIEGNLQRGAMVLEGVSGQVNLYAQMGGITIRNASISGRVVALQGDITLENVLGELSTFTPKGKVIRKYTASFFPDRVIAPQLSPVEKVDLQISRAPKGAKFFASEANVNISMVKDSLSALVGKGDITIASAQGVIVAITDQGKITLTYSGTFTSSKESLELHCQGGDMSLYLPANPSVNLLIEQEQNDGKPQSYKVESDFDLGTVTAQPLTDIVSGKTLYQTRVEKALNGGRCQVHLRVTNGNLFIKQKPAL